MSVYKWGLVIQGPAKSFGQGPNNSIQGFLTEQTIRRNIETFQNEVCQVVVSTWEGSQLGILQSGSRTMVVESQQPRWDPDNRRKQFISTLAGIDVLRDMGATHVLKIRTDQEVPLSTFKWLQEHFAEPQQTRDPTQRRIVVSEFLPGQPFYVGDFIFAGTINTVSTFVRANRDYGLRNLHPSIAVDYVLKYLSRVDPEFWQQFRTCLPYLPQISNPRNTALRDYWDRVMPTYFDFLSREEYLRLTWRGRPMRSIADWSSFGFHENLSEMDLRRVEVTPSLLTATKEIARSARYEYTRYWPNRAKSAYKIIKRVRE